MIKNILDKKILAANILAASIAAPVLQFLEKKEQK